MTSRHATSSHKSWHGRPGHQYQQTHFVERRGFAGCQGWARADGPQVSDFRNRPVLAFLDRHFNDGPFRRLPALLASEDKPREAPTAERHRCWTAATTLRRLSRKEEERRKRTPVDLMRLKRLATSSHNSSVAESSMTAATGASANSSVHVTVDGHCKPPFPLRLDEGKKKTNKQKDSSKEKRPPSQSPAPLSSYADVALEVKSNKDPVLFKTLMNLGFEAEGSKYNKSIAIFDLRPNSTAKLLNQQQDSMTRLATAKRKSERVLLDD